VQEVVITGVGLVCPLGIGREAVWSALQQRASGIRTLPRFVESGFPVTIGGEVPDFDGKQYVQPRKSLKVMCREIQQAVTAGELAWREAGLPHPQDGSPQLDPERLGVVMGASVYRSELDELAAMYRAASNDGHFDFTRWDAALKQLYPLWMLKYLPNMAACQIGIAKDARGPNNTVTLGEVSSLLAVIESADCIARGHADIMLAGAASSLLDWVDTCWLGGARVSRHNSDPAAACRPFDRQRDGFVMAEGAAVFVLESRAHAEQRGVPILGQVRGYGRCAEPVARGGTYSGLATRRAIQAALASSQIAPGAVGHVSAHGLATREDDGAEAAAILAELDSVPVTASKSLVGNSGAAGGAVELALNLIAAAHGQVPATLNCPEPDCGVNVVTDLQATRSPHFLALSHNSTGQAAALMVSCE
jgi:3-oxoacyl-[acyl-carrier-protein] synthase II